MEDILQELRSGTEAEDGLIILDTLCLDAADEIERNREAIAELLNALRPILKHGTCFEEEHYEAVRAAIMKYDTLNTKKGSN